MKNNFENNVCIVKPAVSLVNFEVLQKARVNWSSIGSVEPDEAIEFAKEIIKKANEANSINKKVDLGIYKEEIK